MGSNIVDTTEAETKKKESRSKINNVKQILDKGFKPHEQKGRTTTEEAKEGGGKEKKKMIRITRIVRIKQR